MDDGIVMLRKLKDEIRGFIKEGAQEKSYSPNNLTMSIVIEAAELMGLFHSWQQSTQKPCI